MSKKNICAGPDCGEKFTPAVHNQKYHDPQCKRDAENAARRRDLVKDITAAITPIYSNGNEESLSVEYLRSEASRLARLADKYKNSHDEIVEATYRAVYDAVTSMSPPPKVVKPKLKKVDQEVPQVAVAAFADWQAGKVTPSYSSDILRKRIDLYGDKFIDITNMHRKAHPVNKAHIWLLGDIVEGEHIFAGQPYLLDASLYEQVGVIGPEILRDFILKLLTEFETVHVTGVIGNHGRIGGTSHKDYNGETNMDRLLYKIVEHIFANEPRVTFNIPDGYGERNFYAIDTIGDYKALLLHGDQFPAPTATHGYYKKIMGWKDGAIPQEFNDVYMGHYHQNTKMTLGSSILRIVGSPESYNTYAQEVLAAMGRPSQLMEFIHPVNGVTGEYTIWLDEV